MNHSPNDPQSAPLSAIERDNRKTKKGIGKYVLATFTLLGALAGSALYIINSQNKAQQAARNDAARFESYRQKDAEDHRKQLSALQAQLTNYQNQLQVALQTRPTLGTNPNLANIEELVAVTKLVEGGLYVPSFEGGGLAALTVSNSNKGPVVLGDTRVVTYTRNPLNGLLDTKEELVELGKGFYHLFNDQVALAPNAFYTFATDNKLSPREISKLTDNVNMNYLNSLATASYVFSENVDWHPMNEDMRSILTGTNNNSYLVVGSRKAINELRSKRK